MKKGLIFIFLVMVIAGSVFAQEKTANVRNNWISGELSLFGGGARYERMLNQNLSVGANVYWNNSFLIFNEFETGLSARYYIWGKTFFIGLGLGFHTHTGTFENENSSGSWVGTINGAAITPEIGWKIDVGNPGGFFVQPGAKIPVTFGDLEMYGTKENEFRVGVGFVIYCGLGYAF